MDKFLAAYSPPKLNQEETGNLNRLMSRSEIESVIIIIKKKLPINKTPGPECLHWWMLSNIQRRTYTDPSPNLPKAEEERILPMTFYKRNIILMPKSDRYHQNRKLQTNIFNERAAKISTSISKLNPKPQPSGVHPKFTRMVQHMHLSQWDTPHQHYYLNRCKRSIW